MKNLGWITTILVVCMLVWLTVGADMLWPRLLGGLLLLVIGVLMGLRIGSRSASTYVTDLQRINKVLASQHRDLEELNALLLKQMNAEFEQTATREHV